MSDWEMRVKYLRELAKELKSKEPALSEHIEKYANEFERVKGDNTKIERVIRVAGAAFLSSDPKELRALADRVMELSEGVADDLLAQEALSEFAIWLRHSARDFERPTP